MTKVGALGVLLCTLGVLTHGRSTGDKGMIWFPTDNGNGYVPAFLDSASSGLSPSLAAPDKIHFYLFTPKNKDTYDELFTTTESMEKSHWDRNSPVKIFLHGFSTSFDGGSGLAFKQGYIDKVYPTNVNLILVDWAKLAAAPFYDVAAKNSRLVGEKLAVFTDFLIKNGYTTLDKVHYAGYSLGAHVVGFAGRFYREMNPGKSIPRLTGLDPAFPLFGSASDENRLDSTDADFVDVIHTASGKLAEGELAFIEPRGDIDFYPNKGRDQPGCQGLPDIFGGCSHSRAYEFFLESIHNNAFHACKCDENAWDPEGDDKFTSCSCDKGSAYLGEWTDESARGIYYLATNPKAPFAIGTRSAL